MIIGAREGGSVDLGAFQVLLDFGIEGEGFFRQKGDIAVGELGLQG